MYSPIWTPDGQRLVFNWLNDPRDLGVGCAPIRCYDVAPDGQRFYVVQTRTPPPLLPVTHIDLIQNWLEELKAKVPTGR